MDDMNAVRNEALVTLQRTRAVLEQGHWFRAGPETQSLEAIVQRMLKNVVQYDIPQAQLKRLTWPSLWQEACRVFPSLQTDVDQGVLHALHRQANVIRHGSRSAFSISPLDLCAYFGVTAVLARVLYGIEIAEFPVGSLALSRSEVPHRGELEVPPPLPAPVTPTALHPDEATLQAIRNAYVCTHEWLLENLADMAPQGKPEGTTEQTEDLPALVETVFRLAWGEDDSTWDPSARAILQDALDILRRSEGSMPLTGFYRRIYSPPDDWPAESVFWMMRALHNIHMLMADIP